jgi:hypothetical protein
MKLFQSDKTKKGLELVNPKSVLEPGPGSYSPRVLEITNSLKKNNAS